MPVETLQFDHAPQGFSPLNVFLENISSRPGMDERLKEARKRLAERRQENGEKLSLAQIRMKSGFSQKQLAAAVGTSQPVVSMWEAGTREPSLKNLAALSRLLNISADILLRAILSDV